MLLMLQWPSSRTEMNTFFQRRLQALGFLIKSIRVVEALEIEVVEIETPRQEMTSTLSIEILTFERVCLFCAKFRIAAT